jgi:hypothetical protein
MVPRPFASLRACGGTDIYTWDGKFSAHMIHWVCKLSEHKRFLVYRFFSDSRQMAGRYGMSCEGNNQGSMLDKQERRASA